MPTGAAASVLEQASVLASSLVLLLGLSLLWRRGSPAHIAAFQLQSVALGALAALIGWVAGHGELYVVAALFVLVKGVAMPVLLRRMERRFGATRELEPFVNTATSLVVGGVLVLLAYVVSRPLVTLSHSPLRGGMPLALGLVFVSLFVLVSRKKALTQILAFLMLENGIALLAVLGTHGIPLIVEIGVFLDALMGFLVMQVFVYRIHETFQSLDVDRWRELPR
jgi:hydrogenase-4 component E